VNKALLERRLGIKVQRLSRCH